ncbi:hypothetical protein [Sanyastnella coralliicola]|uniref:hypothetical protein n=1 Tax=Sanyastnella coralliicola TaxID=3069118 RepID=UPI0027BA37EE|nr:hypothetical protein [Longitalea sp. SCSIO 12813]
MFSLVPALATGQSEIKIEIIEALKSVNPTEVDKGEVLHSEIRVVTERILNGQRDKVSKDFEVYFDGETKFVFIDDMDVMESKANSIRVDHKKERIIISSVPQKKEDEFNPLSEIDRFWDHWEIDTIEQVGDEKRIRLLPKDATSSTIEIIEVWLNSKGELLRSGTTIKKGQSTVTTTYIINAYGPVESMPSQCNDYNEVIFRNAAYKNYNIRDLR